MSFQLCIEILNSLRPAYYSSRNICTTSLLLDVKWRERNGLPKNPNAYGPLTNGPDYTYLDGRPTPIGPRLRTRIQKQREIAEKIVKFSEEIDFAVKRHEQKLKAEENAKMNILSRKLKPKGIPFKSHDSTKK